jgi:hypothetical protein
LQAVPTRALALSGCGPAEAEPSSSTGGERGPGALAWATVATALAFCVLWWRRQAARQRWHQLYQENFAAGGFKEPAPFARPRWAAWAAPEAPWSSSSSSGGGSAADVELEPLLGRANAAALDGGADDEEYVVLVEF